MSEKIEWESFLGRQVWLKVVKKVDFGVYLGDETKRVLLPQKEVEEGCEIGKEIQVFLYKDSMDRWIATTRTPAVLLGELAVLRVKEVGSIGVFLDWGLEKDLFLPFREQTGKLSQGDEVLIRLYADKSHRLCATMKVYPYLETTSPYQKEDRVRGRVYEISPNFGVFVAVDDKYSGLIPKKEAYGSFRVGSLISARVTGVKEDGKLDLSVREKAFLQLEEDAALLWTLLEQRGGSFPFTDKASPEKILRETGLSKNSFKRGIGRLLKENRIEILEKRIEIKKR